MYSFQSRVRFSEIGEDKHLTLEGIINYFQDSSTFQSEDLGVGLEVLEDQNCCWVLSFWQVAVERYPKLGEEIKVETWPYAFQGVMGCRNFIMKDKAGEVVAYANSIWVYLDLEKNRPARVPKDIQEIYDLEDKYEMNYAPRKISLPEEMEEDENFVVLKQFLDSNHHVNNEQYIQMAQKYLPEDFICKEMRAEYKKSAVLGNKIVPLIAHTESSYIVALCDEQREPYTIVEFLG